MRRRERVIRIFPNGASAERLLGALLMELDEGWSTGKRYLDLSAYWDSRQESGDQSREAAASNLNSSPSDLPPAAG